MDMAEGRYLGRGGDRVRCGLVRAGGVPRRGDLRHLVRGGGTVLLCDRLPLLRVLHSDQDHAHQRRERHAGRTRTRRCQLRAYRPSRALRPAFCRHLRCWPACRSDSRRADGLPAIHHVDYPGRDFRRCGAGYADAVDFRQASWSFLRSDGHRRWASSAAPSSPCSWWS